MNANMLGLHEVLITDLYNKNVSGIIVSDNGYSLTDDEVRRYVRYCVKKGYENLYNCPDFETVKHLI